MVKKIVLALQDQSVILELKKMVKKTLGLMSLLVLEKSNSFEFVILKF